MDTIRTIVMFSFSGYLVGIGILGFQLAYRNIALLYYTLKLKRLEAKPYFLGFRSIRRELEEKIRKFSYPI